MAEFTEISRELGDKFKILACIKKAETTGVYIAELRKKKVLLKVLFNKLVDAETQNRFKRESRILSKLNHDNIVKIIEWNFGEKISYIVYEYFESRNMRVILREKKLSDKAKIKLVLQLLEGLAYLHKNNVIHRDLKPDNILVNEKLHLKITDFGLSFLHNDEFTTQNYAIVGTPGYMSPELIQGKRATEQSDLFSLGIIIYELYVGKNPFIGEDFNQTLNNILNFNVEKLKTFRDKFPPNIYNILTLLLEVDLQLRAKSAEEILKILSDEKPFKKISKYGKREYKLALSLLILLLTAVYYFSFVHERAVPHKAKEIVAKKEIQNIQEKTETTQPPEKNETRETKIIRKQSADTKTEKPVKTDILPKQSKPAHAKTPPPSLKFKEIIFTSYPWAKIVLDGKEIGMTPFDNPVKIEFGKHTLKIINPFYPQLKKEITIDENTPAEINFNISEEFAYLHCTVFPWGDVFIDGKFIGETPLRDIIAIYPGKHSITIKNPNFPPYKKTVEVKVKDTLRLNINFTEINKKN